MKIYIYIYLKIYLLLIHMFKKITKLSCSFFCNFDWREPSGFLMLLLLLLSFLNPEGFYFRYSSGSYRQVCFHRDPFYTFSPTSRLFLVTTHSFPFYKGRGRSPNRHLTQPTFDTNRHLTQCFCGTDWGETAPSRSKFMHAYEQVCDINL